MAAYDYLVTTPPFKNWKLPASEEVEFRVTLHRDRYGDHNEIPCKADHCIRVSAKNVATTDGLLSTMAHEMVHMRLVSIKARDGHGANFLRVAKQVCRVHGWDLKTF